MINLKETKKNKHQWINFSLVPANGFKLTVFFSKCFVTVGGLIMKMNADP